ncbi:MAG: serine/threonine-protein kinase [Phycisphaerales bacterium]|nr:serine/threonine-protein kinase [Phycisphaerales bacterium]
MNIEPGSHIAQYQVVSLLGRGGMGEVWRARDSRLGRDVALKVLPKHLTQTKERTLRFEREARLLASLSHPNIAAIYGLDEVDGSSLLVLEHIEGETLAARLKRGGLPLDDALEIGLQIAQALEAAHAKGVIHRDLKPGNVMLRPDGAVKVLDFGLARVMETESEPDSTTSDSPTVAAHSPTITSDHTMPGVILGTAPYMSPEQVRGRKLDKRSDIWSFGVVLFECFTGRMLFRGENATDAMGAIVHRTPDWDDLPAHVPAAARKLLRRCLAKERNERLHDIADGRIELAEMIRSPEADAARVAVPGARRATGLWTIPLAFAAGLALTFGAMNALRPVPERPPVRRFTFAADLSPSEPAISRDGKQVAFLSDGAVYVRKLDTLETRKILRCPDENERAIAAVWSPVGDALAVVTSASKLYRVAIETGVATELSNTNEFLNGPCWADDGYIYTGGYLSGDIVRFPERGGASETVIRESEDILHYHGATVLPGGAGILAVPHYTDHDGARTIVLIRADGTTKDIFTAADDVGRPIYSATGHVLFGQDSPRGTWAIPFSLDRLEATGPPVLIVPDHIAVNVSDSGDLVYDYDGDSDSLRHLIWRDRTGAVVGTIEPALSNMSAIALSPDGKYVSVSSDGPKGVGKGASGRDIWIIDINRATAARLAAEDGDQFETLWSPDGTRIAYTSILPGFRFVVRLRRADGAGDPELIREGILGPSFNDDWTEYVASAGSFTDDMYVCRAALEPGAELEVFQNAEGWDIMPRLRPGGGLIAYLSSPGGMGMLSKSRGFLRRYPVGQGRWPISSEAISPVIWSRDGSKLYFLEPHGDRAAMCEVAVTLDEDQVEIGAPVRLFEIDGRVGGVSDFDLSLDGERFLMPESASTGQDEGPDLGIVLVENWYEEFRPRAKQ